MSIRCSGSRPEGLASGNGRRRRKLDMIDLMGCGSLRPHLRIQGASGELTPIVPMTGSYISVDVEPLSVYPANFLSQDPNSPEKFQLNAR